MPSRRQALALAAAATLPSAAARADPASELAAATVDLRRPATGPAAAELARLATLAANNHNAQPWRFELGETGGSILPDLTRRTPVVDPDDHHLFVSLGCAAENLLLAAAAQGSPGAVAFAADGPRLDVDLAPGAPPRAGPLTAAIPERQSTRSVYDGRAVPRPDLRLLEATAAEPGVALHLITDPGTRDAILELVVAGNTAQLEDPAFVAELRDWVRFNAAAAVATGDGLYTGLTGNPSLPTWLGRSLFPWLIRTDAENRRYAAQIRSSPGLAVLVADRPDPDHWTRVGRSFQRFALQATALGIRTAHVNQPIEVPALRPELARLLGLGPARPDLVIRFGYAPPLPMSMRRPATAVLR